MWNCKELDDEFLGEILLDLSEAKIDNSIQCYNLEDHDENSSPLPYRYVLINRWFVIVVNYIQYNKKCNVLISTT